MPYLIKMTVEQLAALAVWATLLVGADVLLDVDGEAHPGRLIVGQGDARCYIDPDGTVTWMAGGSSTLARKRCKQPSAAGSRSTRAIR